MSNQEFENYVSLIGKLLQLRRDERDLIAGELQDHLQMRVADLTGDGVSRDDAVCQALEEFGDAAVMAKNFQKVLELKRRRWMMRFAAFSTAGVFLFAVLTMAMWPSDARFGMPSASLAQEASAGDSDGDTNATADDVSGISEATLRDLKTEETLKRIVDLDFDEIPFSEVLEVLSEETGLNFILTYSAKDDSLTEDEPIKFRLKGMPLAKGLDLMLMDRNATYAIDEGVVLIISRDDTANSDYERIKMFDCRELVAVLPETAIRVSGGVSRGGGGGFGGGAGGGGGGGMFAVPSAQPQFGGPGAGPGESGAGPQGASPEGGGDQSHAAGSAENQKPEVKYEYSREETLRALITNVVNPDSWDENGGMARVEVVGGIVVARHAEADLRDLQNMLDDLEGNLLEGKSKRRMKLKELGLLQLKKPSNAMKKSVQPKSRSNRQDDSEDPFGGSEAPKNGSKKTDSNPFG